MPGNIFLLFLYFLATCICMSSCTYSCRNENNEPVDWFALYKIPEIKDHSNNLIQTGLAYAYISSDNEQGWILSEKSINESSSIPGFTLAPLYKDSSDVYEEETMNIFYNDQPPVGDVKLDGGHTKGVVVADKSGGFWLIHSVPHYPPPPEESYSYPHTGLKNGQSYLCVTLSSDQLDIVGTQLMYNDPHIFFNSTPAELNSLYPMLTKAAIGWDVESPPYYHIETLTSQAGTVFQTFAKTPKFHKDLYSDWVAAALEVDLLVETWPNGAGRLRSSCHRHYNVENVKEIEMKVVGEYFKSTKDHSKWAISEHKAKPWVCIGDINRAESQEERGGGTVCVKDEVLWQAYHSSIKLVETCPSYLVNII